MSAMQSETYKSCKVCKEKMFLRGCFSLVGIAVITVGCGRGNSEGSGSETINIKIANAEKIGLGYCIRYLCFCNGEYISYSDYMKQYSAKDLSLN